MGNSPLVMRRDYGEDKEAFRNPLESAPQADPQADLQGVLEAVKSNESLMKALNEAIETSKINPMVMDRVVQGVYETLRSIPGIPSRGKPLSRRTVCAAALDAIASKLEAAGMIEAAEKIDVIANTLEADQK